jgi:adenylyltransferase/sulfurtransferase
MVAPFQIIIDHGLFLIIYSDQKPTLLLYSALGSPPFRSIKLRPKKPTCSACSNPSYCLASIGKMDYVQFCGGVSPDWVIQGMDTGPTGHRISAKVWPF